MPQTIIKTGIIGPDGTEEILAEYLCDCPDCPNYAEHVIGVAREIGGFAVCRGHAERLDRGARFDARSTG